MAFTIQTGAQPDHIIATPVWMLAIRVLQFVVALVIVGLSGRLIHQAYLDEQGLALAVGIFTWIIAGYAVLTERLPALHTAYNIIAVLALDGFLVILWLATFAAVAAERARYTIDVNVGNCYNDGSAVSSEWCDVFSKRDYNVVLFKTGQDMMSAMAGLGALCWLLFIATFVWTLITFLRARKEGRFQSLFGESATSSPEIGVTTEPKPQPVVSVAPQQQQPPVQYAPPAGSYPVEAYTPQSQHPQGQYPSVVQQPQQPYPQPGAVSPQSMSPVHQQPYQPPPQELYGHEQPQGQYPPPGTYQPPQQSQQQ